MFGSGEIMARSIALQIPYLSYCDSPPGHILFMKLGMHIKDIEVEGNWYVS
jgi:hypothetical protein